MTHSYDTDTLTQRLGVLVRRETEARVLILDNHDDFGGHAKRNEYMVDGQQVIGYGGTEFVEGIFPYEGLELLRDIGLDAEEYSRANQDPEFEAQRRALGCHPDGRAVVPRHAERPGARPQGRLP